MFPYFVLVCVPIIMAFVCRIVKAKPGHYVIDSFFLIWLILLMFRATEVGADIQGYELLFDRYCDMPWDELLSGIFSGKYEAGFLIISKLLSIMHCNFRVMIIVCALIAVIPIWKMYRQEENWSLLLVAMFINIAPFSMYFSGLRQTLAMAFAVPAFYCCRDKNFKKFLLSVFFGMLFHRSALILLLMYPVFHLKLKKESHLLYIIPVLIGIYIFKSPIFSFLMRFAGRKYSAIYGSGVSATGAYAVLLLLFVLFLFSYFASDREQMTEEDAGLRNLLLLSVVIQIFSGVHHIAMRLNYYYLIFVPITISRVLSKSKTDKQVVYIAASCMLCFFTVFFFYHAYIDADILEVFPYRSMF